MEFRGEPSGACPNHFRCSISDARKGGGGNWGYANPAWHLSIHLQDFVEGEDLEELSDLADKEDDKGIIRWFKHYLPRAMKLVPSRRNRSFLKGFWQAVEDGRLF